MNFIYKIIIGVTIAAIIGAGYLGDVNLKRNFGLYYSMQLAFF